jgi:Tol biopolymer transport system component
MDIKFYRNGILGGAVALWVICASFVLMASVVGKGYTDQLSFESLRDGDWDIYVVDLRTGLYFNLTDNLVDDHAATWSPDGRSVAYSSTFGANDALIVADWTGDDASQWTPETFTGNGLTSNWSPDGSQLVIQLNDPFVVWKAFLVQSDYRLRQIANLNPNGSGLSIAWSPDGSQMAYYYHNFADTYSDWQLHLIDPDGATQPLVEDTLWDQRPAWSPDGITIAYISADNGDLYTVNVVTNEQRRLTDESGEEMMPAWSPDGRMLAFVSRRDGNPEIYALDVASGQARRLTFNDSSDVYPAWSSDSRRVTFVSQRDGNREIYVLDTQTGEEHRVTWDAATDNTPIWLP